MELKGLLEECKEFIRPKTLKERLEISKQKVSKTEQKKRTVIIDKKRDVAI